eukprot:1429078-Rhodomonas_salina.2
MRLIRPPSPSTSPASASERERVHKWVQGSFEFGVSGVGLGSHGHVEGEDEEGDDELGGAAGEDEDHDGGDEELAQKLLRLHAVARQHTRQARPAYASGQDTRAAPGRMLAAATKPRGEHKAGDARS